MSQKQGKTTETIEPIAQVKFVDGVVRPVFEENGRQYVIDDDGLPVYGVWYLPADDCEEPIVVEMK